MFGVGKFRGFVNAGGVFKAKTEQGYSKQCFLAKVFGRKPLSHEKCNIFNLSLQINCSKTCYLA
ncbi:hypothetical protein D2C89_00550 [Helicobacter pylori]|nr:hypothetical protein D2C89_00550 [Helicobacter pylori]QEE98743.1 hypothetical protein D2C88_05005 [Helicobacter pylori]